MKALIFASFITLLLTSCSKNENPKEDKPHQAPTEYTPYQKDGLSLSYPSHWKFNFDESPSLYASRGVGFKVSYFSTVYVYIAQDRNVATPDLIESFLKDLKLDTRDDISNFKRQQYSIDKYNGETLTWTHTSVGSSNFELTTLKVLNTPKTVFVVFDLSDEDIPISNTYKKYFLDSISYK